ncbi:hypothetical protein O9929_24585 [Vibrio lentus]|nr:hypothetical protein [Vibrio lentus]
MHCAFFVSHTVSKALHPATACYMAIPFSTQGATLGHMISVVSAEHHQYFRRDCALWVCW